MSDMPLAELFSDDVNSVIIAVSGPELLYNLGFQQSSLMSSDGRWQGDKEGEKFNIF